MSSGWRQVGNRWVFNSRYYDSWSRYTSECWVYVGQGGVCATGWIQSGGSWYYFDPDDGGMAFSGLYTIGSKTYRFDENGHWLG